MKLFKKTIFIGPINLGGIPQGGDQYKNQEFINYLVSQDNIELSFIDTFNWKKSLKVWIGLFYYLNPMIRYDSIVVSASTLSALKVIRWIGLFRSLRNVTYWVVGGELQDVISEDILKYAFLKQLNRIVVQTKTMKEKLNGFQNVERLPNFKRINIQRAEARIKNFEASNSEKNLKLVFMSRITESKGVRNIFEAEKYLNKQVEIDFFGPLEPSFKDEFYSFLGKHDNMRYLGFLDMKDGIEDNLDQLSFYDVFLFPTFWKSEGHAGVLIDAMASGLAVITTDWNSNKEFIHDNFNGKIVQPNNSVSLAEAIDFYSFHRDSLLEHRMNSINGAMEYHADTLLPRYLQTLN